MAKSKKKFLLFFPHNSEHNANSINPFVIQANDNA